MDELIDSNQLQLIEPSSEDDTVKKRVLVARALVQQKNGKAYVKVANWKKLNVITKSEPVIVVTRRNQVTFAYLLLNYKDVFALDK